MDARRRTGLVALLPLAVLVLLVRRVPEACTSLTSSTGPYPPRLETLLGDVAVLAAVAATAWLTLLSAVALAFRAARTPVPAWVVSAAPRSWRPVVAALAGAAVLVATPAAATTGGSASPGSTGASSASAAGVRPPSSVLEGLPLPDRPARFVVADPLQGRGAPATPRAAMPPDAPAPRAVRVVAAPRAERSVHRVQPGETLWTIAADELRASGRTADATRVDRSWRRWYAANRAVIGDDPDALRAGLLLRRPGTASTTDTPALNRPDEGDPR
ncbi:hypothetical protein [Mumia sp. DW29H23]|uniref:hypothetical protein n=1 Tax=Mumia sp. DW29H23 TaxID=3421241 RepID=UPI003D681312